MSKLDDLQKKLKGEKVDIPQSHSEPVGKLAKDGTKLGKRAENKRNPNSGRKPNDSTVVARNFKSWLNTFINEDVWVKVNEYDKKGMPTGRVITIKRPRIANAISKLYEMGIKGDGDSSAIDLLLNRYLGRPAQPLRGEGEDDAPIQVGIQNLGEFIKKVYGQK